MTVTHPMGEGRSRASRPGFGRARVGFIVGVAAVVFATLGYGINAWMTTTDGTYASGNPATWLPKQQLNQPVDRMLVGSYAHPAVTVAGGNVRVKTPSFSALAVVTGPAVPGEGLTYQPTYVTATWTVHIWDVKGNIPLSADDFDSINSAGTEFHLLAPGGTTIPKSVSTGRQATFELRAVVPIGEDLLRWAPNGNNIVAKWDNQVEND